MLLLLLKGGVRILPRAARKISTTGTYHIMIRGINRAVIFDDKNDKNKFLEIMLDTKKETNFELYAYCLMDNHAHFLIKENEISISFIMKKICAKYAAWYNYQHHQVGHLFQDRFKSECVETNSYFFMVLKYILNNPVKGKVVENPGDYKWSSYHEYINKSSLTDTRFFLDMLHNDKIKAMDLFVKELNKEEPEPISLTIEKVKRTDIEAEEIINTEMRIQGINAIGEISVEKRILLIKTLKSKGITNNQIIKTTGLSKSKVIGI